MSEIKQPQEPINTQMSEEMGGCSTHILSNFETPQRNFTYENSKETIAN